MEVIDNRQVLFGSAGSFAHSPHLPSQVFKAALAGCMCLLSNGIDALCGADDVAVDPYPTGCLRKNELKA
jgi:hypothetical protein